VINQLCYAWGKPGNKTIIHVIVVNIKIDNSNDFMYAHSLITSFNNFVSHSMRAESVLYASQQ